MDRCALFVDAGYVLADGAMAVHGTRRRESVSWDYPGLLQLLAGLAMERSRLPLLRCYWYDSTVEGRRTPDHDALADLPGVKLRLAKMRPGRREGVEGEIHRDLTTLARNKAVSDAMVVSAEEDLAQVIADVQDMGMRVTLLHIANDGNAEIPRALRQECDDIVQISASQLRPFAELISGAEPPRRDERDGGMLAIRAGSNGSTATAANGHGGPELLGPAAASTHGAELPGGWRCSVQQPRRSCGRPAARSRPAVVRTLTGPRRRPRRSTSRRRTSARRIARMALPSPAARGVRTVADFGTASDYRRRSTTTEPARTTGLRFPTSRRRPAPAAPDALPCRTSRPGSAVRSSRAGRRRRADQPLGRRFPGCPRGKSCTRRRSPFRRPRTT